MTVSGCWKCVRSLGSHRPYTRIQVMSLSLSDGQYRFTSPDGKSIEIKLKAGWAGFFGPVEHATEIIGTSEGHIVLIELK